MVNEFSIAKTSTVSSISLKAIWVVKADSSYDIYKGSAITQESILIRTIKGQGTIQYDNNVLKAESCTLLLLERKRIRRYFCSNNSWDFWWFEFYTTATPNLPYNMLIQTPILEDEEDQVHECMALLRDDDLISQHLACAKMSVLLYQWLKNSGYSSFNNMPYEKEIREAAQYLQNHLNSNISIEQLAKKSGFCSKYFCKLFKSIYNTTPKRYYIQLKMQAAEALLRNTNMTINEISSNLGYSSPFHFTREFIKYYGCPPILYRKGEKQKD